jgi:hypothetical protein
MKNILTTAGLAAVAVAGFQTKCAAQAVTVDDSKWWQVSASLRGFYDDNHTIAPDNFARESFGFEVRPGLSLPPSIRVVGLKTATMNLGIMALLLTSRASIG